MHFYKFKENLPTLFLTSSPFGCDNWGNLFFFGSFDPRYTVLFCSLGGGIRVLSTHDTCYNFLHWCTHPRSSTQNLLISNWSMELDHN